MAPLFSALLAASAPLAQSRSFVVQNDSFVKDGEVVQVRSSEIHYSRIPRAYWKDRLQRLAAMGMNAVATYVPWNWHEENEGEFDFENGERDVNAFIKIAQDLDLMVLLRAGPYMCGEWEFGGLPAWILNKNVTIRTYEPNYISLVDNYWGKLLDHVKPLLYSKGGPIVMLQVENEYGSYGNVANNPSDKKYIEHLVELANSHLGKGSVVLYTTDGGNTAHMSRGSLPGDSVLTVGDGGWACDAQADFNPKGLNACMNSEDYTGWLTHWGEHMANTTAKDYGVGKAVANGNSFNLYMGHGGSNFGFWSGSNGGGKSFKPDITSYDYDAPVSENGDHGFGPNGDKFEIIRKALEPYAPADGFPAEPAPLPRKAYGSVKLTAQAEVLKSLSVLAPKGAKSMRAPMNMEALGQNYGLIYYEARAEAEGSTLEIQDYPRDRAQVFVDESYNGAIYRPEAAPLSLKRAAKVGSKLGLLVENMGRLNFGGGMTDPKGITTPVTLDGKTASSSWQAYSLELRPAEVAAVSFASTKDCSEISGPVLYKGALEISDEPEDTYMRMDGWTKGIMWVNGFNLGRYWTPKGPQQAFFMPAPYLKKGSNEIIILELEQGPQSCELSFDDKPDFSGTPSAPCAGTPKAGDVLHMRECDESLSEHMAWELRNVSGSQILALGELCLGQGPAKDPQSGKPSATLVACSSATAFVASSLIKAGDVCLDITANGQTSGEAVEWYACQGRENQLWDFQETPAHLQQIVSRMDGKCLSACPVDDVQVLV